MSNDEIQHSSIPILARIPHADALTLRQVAGDVVGRPCWAFGASVLWDADDASLRMIEPVADFDALNVKGDFGHIFGLRAEVRWKRRDDGHYDVLILTEAADLQLPDAALTLPTVGWSVRYPPKRSDSGENLAILLGGLHKRQKLDYVEYTAQNDAVQLIRYLQLR